MDSMNFSRLEPPTLLAPAVDSQGRGHVGDREVAEFAKN